MPLMAVNFQTWLPDFSAARQDFGLKIWRSGPFQYPLPGIKLHEQNLLCESDQNSMI